MSEAGFAATEGTPARSEDLCGVFVGWGATFTHTAPVRQQRQQVEDADGGGAMTVLRNDNCGGNTDP